MRMVFQITLPSAEFNAKVRMAVAMTPEDLGQAGLDDIAEHWS